MAINLSRKHFKIIRVSSLRQLYIYVFYAFSVCILVCTGSASAITQDQKNAFTMGIYYYDTASPSVCSGSVTTLVGSDRVEQSFNFFVAKGLTPAQSAGIIGNLMQEHGLQTSDTPNGYGIAQWTDGRRDALIAYASQQNGSPDDFAIQLGFLWNELTTSYSGVLDKLKTAQDTDTSTNIFVGPEIYPSGAPADPTYEGRRQGGYENPGTPVMVNRLKNAQDVMAAYGQGVTATAGVATSGCNGGGNFATNFVEYKQCGKDAPWANNPYDSGGGGGTICSGGCGPSAMAMIVTNLTGQSVTPADTAAYGMANGTVMSGGGSYWNIAKVIGNHWGLTATDALGQNIAAINRVLQQGGMVLATGTGAVPFTTQGHFIVIRALTPDGKWLTGNSANIDSSVPYDPQTVISSGSNSPGFNAWGLTKQ